MKHSSAIKQQFQLRSLSADWQAWFDADWHSAELLGEFDHPIPAENLANLSGFPLMAGLIPPDCIPIIGNGYGDWICARVTADNSLGELIHWYHGGGDWIPVGENLPQALLHDFVDQFRPKSNQMLRGATEIGANAGPTVDPQELMKSAWFAKHSSLLHKIDLNKVVAKLAAGLHFDAIELLHAHSIAFEATACDQIEHLVATPVSQFASPKHAAKCGLDWSPDYLRLLFDYQSSPSSSQGALTSTLADARQAADWQDWAAAGAIAQGVLSQRSDLGWARDIGGWAEQRQGNFDSAIAIYSRGLSASTFSDQGVRMRTHWIDPTKSNFAAAQLDALSQSNDSTKSQYTIPSLADLIDDAQQLQADGRHADAYQAFFRAGWGVGFSSIDDCISLLQSLVENALGAGWQARAATAAAHLQIVLRRKR